MRFDFSVPFKKGFSLRLILAVSTALLAQASWFAVVPGCAGSQCTMTCNATALCMKGGCFSDKKDKCQDYQDAPGWTTQWTSGSVVRCDQIVDANKNVTGVTCKGTEGELAGESCTCNFVYANGVKQCG